MSAKAAPVKIVVMTISLVCMTILVAVGRVEWQEVDLIFTAIVMYALGNGIATLNGKTPEPLVRPRSADD